jgi:t-SNARE complex subunit (syntaxin)
VSEAKIITQQGEPVDGRVIDGESEIPTPPIEDIRAAINDINEGVKGFRKIRNSIILKFGIVLVTIKVVDVAGKIIMENQRLKAKPQQDEKK